jgi:hypothetical protein
MQQLCAVRIRALHPQKNFKCRRASWTYLHAASLYGTIVIIHSRQVPWRNVD